MIVYIKNNTLHVLVFKIQHKIVNELLSLFRCILQINL